MKKRSALVIDDETIVLESVRRILAEEHYQVETTTRGREGIAWARERSYDVVLSDVRMPDMGGMIVLREIKRAKPALPVVMITGYATVKSAVQAMKLGAADFIEKPFTPEELLGAVAAAQRLAASRPAEDQSLIHKDEIRRVLDLAVCDRGFFDQLLKNGVEALEGYDLTGPEKLALLTGDIGWIERNIGSLSAEQKQFFELKATFAQLTMEGFF